MRKFLSIILVLFLLCSTVGCDPMEDKKNMLSSIDNAQKKTALVENERLSGTLNVYAFATGIPSQDELQKAEDLYQKLFPNVELKIDQIVNESGTVEEVYESMAKLQSEIMVGKGPDVIWVPGEIVDPYKTVEAGAYLNLYDYFDNDPYFNPDDFNMSVIQGDQPNGQIYIVPLSYNVPLFLTIESVINQTGFQVSKCRDYFSCGAEISRVMDENKMRCPTPQSIDQFFLPYLCPQYTGIDWIDYQENKVDLTGPQTVKAFEMVKDQFFQNRIVRNDGFFPRREYYTCLKQFQNNEVMFAEETSSCLKSLITDVRALAGSNEIPVIFPWRDVNGKIQSKSIDCVAVTRSCKNQEAAYQFVKMMMCPEYVSILDEDTSIILQEVPINYQSVRNYLEGKKNDDKINYEEYNGEAVVGLPLQGLEDTFIDEYMNFLYEVDGTSYDTSIWYTLRDMILPAYQNEKSLNSCLKEAQAKLSIYVSE